MKRIYVFDIDNTLRSSNHHKVLPNNYKLVEELSKNPNNILVLATGRGPSKINIIDDLTKHFHYMILVNGAVIIKNDKVIHEDPIKEDIIESVIKDATINNMSVGMVGFDEECITMIDDNILDAFNGYIEKLPRVDPNYYKNQKVYQLWAFNKDTQKMLDLAERHPKLNSFLWHRGGIDLVNPISSKDQAIKKIITNYNGYQLICVGDGHNDLDMIKMADLGVLMGNSKYISWAVENNIKVAPHIDEDGLYDFFVELKLV